MNVCRRCQESNPEYAENCQKCGQYLTNEDDELRIQRFKKWFVVIVLFCVVMFFVLPR